MVRLTVVLAGALGLFVTGCGGDEGFKDPDPPVGVAMLPDIVPSPPEHVQMSGGQRWTIAFSSTLVNVGRGDFILRAKRNPGDGEWRVDQVIPYSKGGGEVVSTLGKLVWGGDGHEHWHVLRVATNRLVRLDAHGKPVSGKSWVDSKIGFCFYDFVRHLKVGAKDAHYGSRSCGSEGDRYIGMGLSRGWADVYPLNLPGQTIDVTDVPDGTYRLIADVDESGWFREMNSDNNQTWVDIELSTKSKLRFAKVVGSGPDPGKRVVPSPHAIP